MHGNRFDTMTQELSSSPTRRRLVGGAVAALAAVLTGRDAEARNGGKGKGKGKGKAQGNGKAKGRGRGNGNGNGNGLGRGTTKVSFCHKTDDGGYVFITVAEPARQAHEGHDDVECLTDPCADSIEPCTVVCTAEGVCVAEGSAV